MKCKLGVAALAVMAATSAARAQETTTTTTNPLTFGVKAGVTFPIGTFGDASGTGWHVGALVGYQSTAFPLGLRADLVYEGLGEKDFPAGVATLTNKPKIINGTVNAVWEFPTSGATTGDGSTTSTMKPYIIGGLGFYHIRASLDCTGSSTVCAGVPTDTESNTKFGINAGGGVQFQLAGFAAFAEARWHGVFSGYQDQARDEEKLASFIPISFGLMFR